METLTGFRKAFGRISLGVTFAAALVVALFDMPAAGGVLLGGGGGTLAYWATARSVELAAATPDTLKSGVQRWGCLRFLLYALAVMVGYRIDPVGWHGVFGAAGGLVVPYCVIMFLGLTGYDVKPPTG